MFRKTKAKVDEDPRSYLLKILGSRDYSRAQLELKLKGRGHPPDKIQQALEDLLEAGLFKEESFAEARVRALLRKGYGPSWIKSKLRSQKIEVQDALVAAAYDHLGFSEVDQVRDSVRKALRSSRLKKELESDFRTAQAKLVKRFAAKGHSPTLVSSVLKEIL